ncbi:MAG: class I SAM-dependent methyltransferase [Planctomycetota bacterium]|nr:class I SAM-dependent methyltransferase [Planctomycetota bacterium]
MSARTIQVDERLHNWLLRNSHRDTEAHRHLREVTLVLEDGAMQTSPEQTQFLFFLARSLNATRAIEVGVYTGASAMAIASALPNEGRLVACDISDEHLATATSAWKAAGVEARIDSRIGPAVETLAAMLEEPEAGHYDFMYVDADKENSLNYYEHGLKLLRTGGVIAIDNLFRGGRVADPAEQDESTVATRELAQFLLEDERIDYSLVPIGDGLALARIV